MNITGVLTSSHIYNNYVNINQLFFHSKPVPDVVQKFYEVCIGAFFVNPFVEYMLDSRFKMLGRELR